MRKAQKESDEATKEDERTRVKVERKKRMLKYENNNDNKNGYSQE